MVCVFPGRASICPVVVLRSWEPPALPITIKYITYLSSWSACCRAGRVSALWLC